MTSFGPWLGAITRGGGGGGLDVWWPFSDVWDPFSLGTTRCDGDEAKTLALANVDWRETNKAHVFRVDLPGVGKENIKVQVEDGNVLQISGEVSKEVEDANDKWNSFERQRGRFMRRFRLPDNVNTEDIKCSLQNGVLTVNVPKKEEAQKKSNVRYIDVA